MKNKKSEEALKLDKELTEIEKLQDEVERILNIKNPLVRFHLLKKARKLHEEAERRMQALIYPYKKL